MTSIRPPQIVGVILSEGELRRALRMRTPPDYFELRLDGFVQHLDTLKTRALRLRAPLIITARHPREGGASVLSAKSRQSLLFEFLDAAAFVDIELRSVPAFAPLLRAAAVRGVRTIVSFHDFGGTPSRRRLEGIAAAAGAAGADVIKIATRTDTESPLLRLLDFFDSQPADTNVVAMGIGDLGRRSRRELALRGCRLNYGHLGTTGVPGQLSVRELRQVLRETHRVCRPSAGRVL